MKYPINNNNIKRALALSDGPEEFKTITWNFLSGNNDALIEDPFVNWIFNVCPPAVRAAILHTSFHFDRQKLEHYTIETTIETQKNESCTSVDIIARPTDYEEIIKEIIDLKILNAYGKLNQRRGNKEIFIGVLLLLYRYGYFKKICNNVKVSKTTIADYAKEKFDAGDMQQFMRTTEYERYIRLARAKVKCIDKIELKRKQICNL